VAAPAVQPPPGGGARREAAACLGSLQLHPGCDLLLDENLAASAANPHPSTPHAHHRPPVVSGTPPVALPRVLVPPASGGCGPPRPT
jgi:hypothetical protein